MRYTSTPGTDLVDSAGCVQSEGVQLGAKSEAGVEEGYKYALRLRSRRKRVRKDAG